MAEPSSPASGGYRYSVEHQRWLFVEAPDRSSTEPATLDHPLRLATLNCLHDLSLPDVLHHEVRHEAICRELQSLDADIIGLNEVTTTLLERLLREEWVRRSYTASVAPEDERCARITTLLGGFGNLLLSRIRPASVEYIDQPGDGRHSHVMTLSLCGPRGGEPLSVDVCSTHLTACPWLMEGRRKLQLAHLTSALTARSDGGCSSSACVVMGDYNFHRESENASIPDGWTEVPAVVALGETWDFGRNALLAHYLPVRNIYNGLGLGASLGWPSPMRLDRVLVHASGRLDLSWAAAATARIFADQPIHERARGRQPLPQAGPELRAAHRAMPWQEYLHQSDHFGICVDLPIVPT